MNRKSGFGVAVAVGVLAGTAGTEAALIPFASIAGVTGPDAAGLNLSLEVQGGAGSVDLVFRNDSSGPGVVTAVYIETSAQLRAILGPGEIVDPQGAGVDFRLGASPANPVAAVADFGGAWRGTFFGARAQGNKFINGLSAGESLTVRFALLGSLSMLSEGLSAGENGFRVVQRAEGLSGGGETWALNQAVPTPGTGVLALMGFGLAAIRRRR